MASNRKVQRLLNEFMDLLSEYESSETNIDRVHPVNLPAAIDQVDLNRPRQVAEQVAAPAPQAKESGS